MFRSILLAGSALALVVLTTSNASAQFGGRGIQLPASVQNIFLLRQEAVQKELALNDEQKKAIGDLAGQMQSEAMEIMSGLQDLTPEERQQEMPGLMKMIGEKGKELQTKVDKVLDPKQQTRMKELSLQSRGLDSFDDEEVAKALKLTDDQKTKLTAIKDDAGKKRGELMQAAAGGDNDARAAALEKGRKLQQEATDAALAVLTPDQKTAFDKLKGAKFEFPRQQGRRGGL